MWTLADRTIISTLALVASDFSYKSLYSSKPGGVPQRGEQLSTFPDNEPPGNEGFPSHLLSQVNAQPLAAYDSSNLATAGTVRFLDWELLQIIDSADDGFGAMLFRSKTPNPATQRYEYILSLRGTEGLDAIDWWQNIDLARDVWVTNEAIILQLLNTPTETGSPSDGVVHFTGQSLGGGLAQYAAYAYFLDLKARGDFEPSRLTLTTFNAFGGIRGIRERDEFFKTNLTLFANVPTAHYVVENDIVHKLGVGDPALLAEVGGSWHLNGTGNTYQLAFRRYENGLPVAPPNNYTGIIDAHRIEAGFYRGFKNHGYTFAQAEKVQAIDYIDAHHSQRLASYYSRLYNDGSVTRSEARVRTLIGIAGAALSGRAEERRSLLNALNDALARSGGDVEVIRSLKSAALEALVAVIRKYGTSTSDVPTLRLSAEVLLRAWLNSLSPLSAGDKKAVFAGVNDILGTERALSVPSFDGLDDSTYALRHLQFVELAIGTASLLDDPELASIAERDPHFASVSRALRDAHLEPAALAAAISSAPNSLSGAIDYLEQAIAAADWLNEGERHVAAQSLMFALAREARVVAGSDQAVLDGVRADIGAFLEDGLAAAIHNANPETLAKKTTSISLPTPATVPELRATTDAFLHALTNVGEKALALLTGSSTAEAAEVRENVARIRDIVHNGSQSVVLRQGHVRNPFDANEFDPEATPIAVGALAEGAIRTFTVYMPYPAGAGGQRIKLTLSGAAADKLSVLDQSDVVRLGADGVFALMVPEGRREITFSLWAKEDIDADETLELSAQLVDSAGEPTYRAHPELSLQVEGVDESRPQTGLEISGAWAPKPYTDPDTGETYYRHDEFGNIERLAGTPNDEGFQEPDKKLDGSSGPDRIVTGDFEETAYGFEGDDEITGSDRWGSIFFGGAGNDWLEALDYTEHVSDYSEREYLARTIGLGEDKLYGGAGDDRIYGGQETTLDALDDPAVAPTNLPGDWSSGGSGSDHVFGGAGDDVLMGGIGEDLLVGGAGMDVLLGDDHFLLRPDGNFWRVLHPNFGDATAGFGGFELGLFPVVNAALAFPDLVFPQTGDPDFMYYKNGGGADVLIGGAGRDILIGQAGDDTLYGGDDDDVLAGWEGDDELLGGRGDDLIAGDFGRYEQIDQRLVPGAQVAIAGVLGSASSLGSLVELSGSDLLDGGAGDDTLLGEAGNDVLLGGDGADTLYGDALYLPDELHGNDILDGGEGNDRLYGNGGDDRLLGAVGTDALFGGRGNDFLDAGLGDDALSGEEGDDVLRGGDGADTMLGGVGADDLRGGYGDDVLDGGDGDDVMYGDAGADRLVGGAGKDRLYGGSGEDVILGGDGDDFIDGGDGIDVLRGGAGDDTYVLGFGHGRDLVEDSEGRNRIQFGSSIDARDLRIELDSESLLATLTYSSIDDSVSVDVSTFQIDTIDFIDGSSWTRAQFVNALPALVSEGFEDDETLEANPNVKNELNGFGGDDALLGGGYADILAGGDGDDWADGRGGGDIYLFTATETGIDVIRDTASNALAYLDWYYGLLGADDWPERAAYGGKYHAVRSGEGGTLDVYYDSYEEALGENASSAIDFIDPLPSIAPLVRRDDDTAIQELIAATIVPRDVVSFGAEIALEDLVLTVKVSGAAADAYPAQPWHDGGTLSVRWNEGNAGFDLEVPEVGYGLVGSDLLARIGEDEGGEPLYAWQTYRLGEGIEAFRFADGSEYSLEEMLARATVIPAYGDYFFERGSGAQSINRFSAAIVFEAGIFYGELEIARDGLDLLLTLDDGSAQGRLVDWYADPLVRPGLELRFADGVVVDEEGLSQLGLFVVGTGGDDVLIGLGGFSDWLDGDLGDDVVEGGSGDDNVFGGEGNDIVRGGPGADDIEAWGEGNNFLDAGAGNDYVYTESPTLVIGGGGDDWIDFYGDGGIAAFNPGDGQDTVYVAGTLTLSLGGGIAPENLALNLVESEAPGVGDLLLALGETDSIRLSRQWEDDPEAWPAISLQLFGSVHRFDFNAIIDELLNQGAGPPGFVLRLGGLLEATRIDFSETAAVGGALAWRYATMGSVAALSDEDIRSLIVDPAFGLAPQPIESAPSNRPPGIVLPLADRSVLEDAAFEISVADAFADPDAGDSLTLTAALASGSALPAWLAFDSASATFSGTPANDDVGVLEITVTATDSEGEKVSDTFSLEVVDVNDPPLAADDIGAAQEDGGPVTLSAAALLANDSDVDAGDGLAIVAVSAASEAGATVGLVDGDVVYDPGTQFQSLGTGATLIDHFDYTIADQEGETSTARVAMTVTGVNDAPVLIEPIARHAGRVGEALAFSLGGAFADVDADDSLSYGASLADGATLPDWLVFDPLTASFSGTPAAGTHGSYTVRVTATDVAGATAEAAFALAIQAPQPADPGGHGRPGGWHHGHDHDDHPGRGKGHDKHWKHQDHGKHDHDRRSRGDHGHDGLHDREKKLSRFDFDALLEHFERDERRDRRSHADIRRGWQKVARYTARLGSGEDDAAQGLHWQGARDPSTIVSGGTHGFGFEGSTGAARGGDDFKCFEGLREGFRRL